MSSQLVQQQKCPQGRKTLPTCANNTFLFANLCTFFIGQCKLFMQQWEKLAHNLMKGEMFADAQSRMVFLPLGPGKWHTVASPPRPLNKFELCKVYDYLGFSFPVCLFICLFVCLIVCLFVCLFLSFFVCFCLFFYHLSFSFDAFLISRSCSSLTSVSGLTVIPITLKASFKSTLIV